MADYTLLGYKWGSATPGIGGGVVTWAPDPSLSPFFVSTIRSALNDWSLATNIVFKQVASLAAAQLDLVIENIDGQRGAAAGNGGASAVTSGTPLNVETGGIVRFDSGDVRPDGTWTYAVQPASSSLYSLALHEIGHAIGIGHYNDGPAVMDGTGKGYGFATLQASDINAARSLYGTRPDAPVYRFFDTTNGDHFYTSSPYEQSAIRQTNGKMTYEQSSWAAPAEAGDTVDVFRFFDTKTGNHFLTIDTNERDVIGKTLPNFVYEGVAFQAYADASHEGALQLDRFFNTATGQHHFAGSAAESAGIKAGAAGANWVYEGAGLIVHQPVDTLIV